MTNHEPAIKQIEALYNPEFDVAAPRVSHVEKTMLEIIQDLIDRVEDLENKMDQIELPDYDY